MKVSPWTTLASEPIVQTRVFTLRKTLSRSPITGKEGEFQVIDAPDWVNIIALTPDEHVLLIRQFRHGTNEITVEIPGGTVDPGEAPLETAKRELLEETGFKAEHWEECGVVEPNPAILNNQTHIFVARDAKPSGPQRPDEHEEIEVNLVPLTNIPALLRNGTIRHALVVCAFAHFALKGSIDLTPQTASSPRIL